MTEKKTFSVRMTHELYEKLEDIAWKVRKNKGDIVVDSLIHYFKLLAKAGKL